MLRKVLFMSVVVLAVGVVASVAMAGDEAVPMTEATPMAAEEAAVAVNVGNTVCPVMGTVVENPSAFTVEHEGKVYNLCCSECKETFLSDPAVYVAKVEAQMAPAEWTAPAETEVLADTK